MNTTATIRTLRASGQDYEWYPTTTEIIHAFWNDIRSIMVPREEYASCGWRSDDGLAYTKSLRNDEASTISIFRMLDVGTGDGRVFTDFPEIPERIEIVKQLGIEKADYMADSLIAKCVWLLGRDYMHTTLIGKQFDLVYSNPPYSIFKPWCMKLLNEVSTKFLYLVIPDRWEDDTELKAAMERRFDVSTVGHYDFSEGDREARAKVSLLRLESKKAEDDDTPFHRWIKENIGEFKKAEKEEDISDMHPSAAGSTEVGMHKSAAESLLESYQQEMFEMVKVYRALSGVDFKLLSRLGIVYGDVVRKIKEDIDSIKYRYWEKALSTIDAIKKRLTVSTGKSLVEKMKEFKELDFNEDNILNVVTWIVQNVNNYSVEQLNKCYDDMTDFENVRAYKSNDVWIDDHWRYGKVNKKKPGKYTLDYRIVVSNRTIGRDHYEDGMVPLGFSCSYNAWNDNIVADLCVVANTLGFPNNGIQGYIKLGQEHTVEGADGKELIGFRSYKNGNVHIKVRQDLMRTINVEVGRLRNWLKSPSDVESEFDISREEAEKLFNFPKLQMIGSGNIRLLE